jgi:nitroreductase
MEWITSRRSIRAYTGEPVSEDLIKELLLAAMSAPSAGNQQPWHFIVITDPRIMSEIPKFHEHAQMLEHAAAAILVCGDLTRESHGGMWVQDCSAATQNLLLAAHSKGLGAVWVGIFPREERMEGLRKLFRFPKNVIPLSLVPIGWPAESKPTENRYNSARVHFNRW